jgi:hypothetical protein
VRNRAAGTLFVLSGVFFVAGVLDPPILPTWGGSATAIMATASAHRTAWFASTWLITLSIAAGLAAVELHVRTLDTDLARVFLIATVLLLGQYAAFRGALPFPQFLAFIAIDIAALVHRTPTVSSPSRESAELAAND